MRFGVWARQYTVVFVCICMVDSIAFTRPGHGTVDTATERFSYDVISGFSSAHAHSSTFKAGRVQTVCGVYAILKRDI